MAFQPCGANDAESTGWTPPREGGALVHECNRQLLIQQDEALAKLAFPPCGTLVHECNRQLLIQLTTESKIMPASSIAQILKVRCAELEQQQGFKPGRKQQKELKEQIIDELLPRALVKRSSIRVWIDPVGGWLVMDTPAAARADHVFKCLLKSLETLPVASLRTERSPLSAMTDWLAADEAPAGFTVDRDTELRSSGEGRATVRYVNHSLEVADIRQHIAAGKQCTKLGMTWNDRISFVLTEALILKRVAALDILKEGPLEATTGDERFDNDFTLMAGEYSRLLVDLVMALGGLAQERKAA